jgi:hypothetical protein
VALSLIPFAGGTTQDQERLQTDAQAAAWPGIPGPGQQSITVQVAPVPDVGDQAAVVFRLDPSEGGAILGLDLIFWAGDAEVTLDLSYQRLATLPRAVLLAHAVAMATPSSVSWPGPSRGPPRWASISEPRGHQAGHTRPAVAER